MCIGRKLLPCSERLLRPRQDPSTDARDDKDDFCFQRSFDCALLGLPKIAAKRDFWEEERQALRAGRQAQRAVCHGTLTRRGRDDRRESCAPSVGMTRERTRSDPSTLLFRRLRRHLPPRRKARVDGRSSKSRPHSLRIYAWHSTSQTTAFLLESGKNANRAAKRRGFYMERRADMTISSMPEAPLSTAPLTARTLSTRV